MTLLAIGFTAGMIVGFVTAVVLAASMVASCAGYAEEEYGLSQDAESWLLEERMR